MGRKEIQKGKKFKEKFEWVLLLLKPESVSLRMINLKHFQKGEIKDCCPGADW